ncbi:hypothetical protein BDR26DRAFT_897193 [Obelidium mucronatum]|nr:hypothetical protein BDR26DRAFT_897193 [Obelidium mucronatum]
MSLQTQVDKVLEMCPGFPRDIIEADLKKTGTVEVTVERIFTGILSPNPQTKPVAVPPVRVSTNPVLQNRRPQSIASPGNPSVPRPPQLNQPSYYQNYHQQQQPQQTQPGQYYNAYGQYQQQRPSQYPSYDPQATPRMESAGRPEFQATPYSYVNPATSTGQYSGPDIQTTPVMHINPSTTNSQYNGTPASQVLGQPTQTSPQSQPANLSQQLPPPPAGMQYVMYNGQYYIQHIVAQPVRPQTIGYPVQQQLPQRPTSSLSSYSGQGGFYPQPPRPQGYPQQPVMQPTQQSYHNPSPAPPQVNSNISIRRSKHQ